MRIRWPKVRYSLCTLLTAVLLAGAIMWVRRDWEPWVMTAEVRGCNSCSPPPVFSPDGRTIVTAAAYSDACLALWDSSTGRLAGVLDMAAPAPSGVATVPKRLAFSHNGRYLWGAYGEHGFRLWNLETRQEVVSATLRNCYSSRWPDGLQLGDVETDEPLGVSAAAYRAPRCLGGVHEPLTTVQYGPRPMPSFPDGRRLLKGDSGNEELAVLALDGAVLARLRPPPSDGSGARLGAAIISPDGERLATSYRGNILLWRRVRPEWWWGVVWLPAFWVMAAFTGTFLWSVWKDRETDHAGPSFRKQDRDVQP